MKIEEVNDCTMADLEYYYDRKIPELCGLVEESIGSNRKLIKVLIKELSMLENHTGMFNGVSKEKREGRMIF